MYMYLELSLVNIISYTCIASFPNPLPYIAIYIMLNKHIVGKGLGIYSNLLHILVYLAMLTVFSQQ